MFSLLKKPTSYDVGFNYLKLFNIIDKFIHSCFEYQFRYFSVISFSSKKHKFLLTTAGEIFLINIKKIIQIYCKSKVNDLKI
jgi:hypothetical protein